MTPDILMQESIMFACLTALVGFLVWLLFRRRQIQTHLEYHRLEVLNKMIDKYGTSGEFIAFMQTEVGKRLIQAGNSHPNGGGGSGNLSVLRFMQVGVMLFVLGAGFMIGAGAFSEEFELGNIQRTNDMQYWGTMCFMLAIGLWMVSIITFVWNKVHDRSARRIATSPEPR